MFGYMYKNEKTYPMFPHSFSIRPLPQLFAMSSLRRGRIVFAPHRLRLIHAIVSFPLLDVEVRILGTLFQAFIVTGLCSNFAAHERCELFAPR